MARGTNKEGREVLEEEEEGGKERLSFFVWNLPP